MLKRYRFIILTLILSTYSLLYIATSRYTCDTDCESITAIDTTLRKNRDYVAYTMRCGQVQGSDSICVWVSDSTGIDWNLLADTVCQLATINGLSQQKVFILKTTSSGFPDTVARMQCL